MRKYYKSSIYSYQLVETCKMSLNQEKLKSLNLISATRLVMRSWELTAHFKPFVSSLPLSPSPHHQVSEHLELKLHRLEKNMRKIERSRAEN